MAKIEVTPITSGYNVAALNETLQNIEEEFKNKVVYRDEVSPMERSLDMNGERLINLSNAQIGTDAATLNQVQALLSAASGDVVSTLTEEFEAASGQTLFTLNSGSYFPGADNIRVYINGLLQNAVEAYTETSPTSITFTEPLKLGDVVHLVTNILEPVASVDPLIREQLAAASGASIIGFQQAGGVARTVEDKLREKVSVKDFGAVGDGVTDDGPAFLAWMDYLNTTAPSCGHLPAGEYNIVSITGPLNILSGGISIQGDGSASTHILYGYNESVFYRDLSESLIIESFSIKGVSFQGPTADVTVAGYGSFPIFIYNTNNILLEDVRITKCPSLATAFRNCERITFIGCVFDEIARGGINVSNSRYTSITGCRFFKIGDDSISLHEGQGTMQISQHSITGCTFYMGSGIKGLGTRNVACTGNTFEFMVGLVFDVRSVLPGDNEGSNATLNVVFSGNTVKDTFNTAHVSAVNGNRTIVRISGDSANAFGLDAVPTYPNTSGVIIRPEPYVYNYSAAGSPVAIPPSGNIIIANNAILQTIPEVPNFSDLGFGEIFSYEGSTYDPVVDFDTLMDVDFVSLSGYLNNVSISGNIVSGVSRFAFFSELAGFTLRLRNVRIFQNTAYNIRVCGFEPSTSLDFDPDALDIEVSSNTFDIDPYLVNSNRATDGSWLVYGATSTPGIIFMARGNNLSQIRFRNNTVKNALGVGVVSLKDNLFIGDVVSINSFNTSNKGVGFVPYGEQVMLVESTPTSATYGSLINTQLFFNNAIPTTGKYVAGHVVRNITPSVLGTLGSQYVINGWLRVTTGTNHVNGIDWVEQRTLTGT